MRTVVITFFIFILKTVQASDPYPRNDAIDIRHYLFKLELNDSTNRIGGETIIDIRFKKEVTAFELDLANVDGNGQGMWVAEILLDREPLRFTHEHDRIKIQLVAPSVANEDKQFTIRYAGIPRDGLIISKNRYGDRTFFGDNWPNFAHQWLPTIDHPYDKATCEFIVTAPEQYGVIATGEKMEESALPLKRKLTHWRTSVALPTKVMVMGAARFAISYLGKVNGTPLESWVYPQDRTQGFYDYALAAKPLDYFSRNIAPYPFEKLANVQSTTRFGGMENASNIFYYEKSVTGNRTIESLLAHEIAHQWFGDSASEADWTHVWLSEGFATYCTLLYLEATYGSNRLREEMVTDRNQVIAYAEKDPTPIVNPSIKDIKKVLNTNTYQKASWVLHMLRQEVGDVKFWEGLRTYYQKFQLGNAMTDDFRKVMEVAAGKDLKLFFDQWIFKAGFPRLQVTWDYDVLKKQIRLAIVQQQDQSFDFSLEIGLGSPGGSFSVEKVRISTANQEIVLPCPQKPTSVKLDPNVWLLFQGALKERSR